MTLPALADTLDDDILFADTGPFVPDQVLWCMHCERIFTAREVRPEPCFGCEGCAYCGASGFGIDLFTLDDARAMGAPVP